MFSFLRGFTTRSAVVTDSRRAFSTVNTCENIDSLKSVIDENKDNDKLIVVNWFATWCGPCRAFSPVYTKLSEQNTDSIFLKADVDQVDPDELEGMPSVTAVPSFFLIKNGTCIQNISGANEAILTELIKKHA